MEMTTYNIQLDIILDGIKPKAFTDFFETDYSDNQGAQVNKFYDYKNYGVEEVVHAVTVAKEANCNHNYYFAPFEATPQVYFLHDSYMGANMCAYPDLLMYVWYNFIIDIDLENEEFEWVKYSKENRLNEKRNLSKMFLNSGYMIPKGGQYKDLPPDEIKKRIILCNTDDQYSLRIYKFNDALEVLDNPWIMSLNHEIEWIRKNKFHYDNDYPFKTNFYGKKLDKLVYFCLYKGVLSPKICEGLAMDKNCSLSSYLNIPAEEQYSKLNTYLNKMAVQNVDEHAEENAKSIDADNDSTSAGSQRDRNNTIDPLIARMINSDAFNAHTGAANSDYINTINLCCKCLKDYFESEESQTASSDTLVSLKPDQMWTYVLLHL